MKKVGIVQFPGSNCDQDVFKSLKGKHPEFISSQNSLDYSLYKAFIIPGGFSYGDYLRAGALAAQSPAIKDIIKAANKGWPILGICNGFQILCETKLLDGILLTNKQDKFIDAWSNLLVTHNKSFWTQHLNSQIKLPISNKQGRYFINQDGLKSLQDNNQIFLSYKNNPNGSICDIAAINNKQGNVAGLMPHPERAIASWMGGQDGISFFQNL